jgi:hypothetical protein
VATSRGKIQCAVHAIGFPKKCHQGLVPGWSEFRFRTCLFVKYQNWNLIVYGILSFIFQVCVVYAQLVDRNHATSVLAYEVKMVKVANPYCFLCRILDFQLKIIFDICVIMLGKKSSIVQT